MNAAEQEVHKYSTPDGHKIVFVNAYSVSRHFGGHEEGGWYYDVGIPICSVPVREEDETVIELEKRRITELLGWEKNPPRLGRYSVVGGSDFEIYVEDEPAKAWPEETPHYE